MSDGADRDPYEEAEERGCIVVVPNPYELFVDIDDEASLEMFKETLDILNRDRLGKQRWSFVLTQSPSGKPHHWHAVVTMDKPELNERIRLGLQAILGSDRKREVLCWLRVDRGDHPVTVFFEKPGMLNEPENVPAKGATDA